MFPKPKNINPSRVIGIVAPFHPQCMIWVKDYAFINV